MPNEIPGFLRDFMEHRAHMTKQDKMSPAVKKSESLKPANKNELNMAIEGIIDKQPKSKVVKEFFQNRVDDLTKIKMK